MSIFDKLKNNNTEQFVKEKTKELQEIAKEFLPNQNQNNSPNKNQNKSNTDLGGKSGQQK